MEESREVCAACSGELVHRDRAQVVCVGCGAVAWKTYLPTDPAWVQIERGWNTDASQNNKPLKAIRAGYDPDPDEKAFIRRFISSRAPWRFASTMPKWPHEYVVRQWRTGPSAYKEFDKFVRLTRMYGLLGKWTYRYNLYLHVDGWKYWTMGWPVVETVVINRARVPARLTGRDGEEVEWGDDE